MYLAVMDSASIQDYVESAQPVIEDSPQMQEATTKASLLNDFIELLGWEIPTNTELEYSVKAFGKTFKVDYALILGGQPVAFLEAKGLDTTLTSDHREQLTAYLQNENVRFGILTNGQEYEFYYRYLGDSNSQFKVEAVERTTLQKLPDKKNIIGAYQAQKIRNEESRAIIEHIRELRKSRDTLADEKDELATAVVDLLTDTVSDAIESEAQTQAKEMIDRLITDIDSEVEGETPVSGGSGEDSPTLSESYTVDIFQDGNVIETFEGSIQSDLMASVVNYLVESHDLISAIEPLPYIPAKKRAIINDEPTYSDRQMKQPRELEQGYYLEVNLSWDQKQRELERLADACGLEVIIEE
jgi:predicted type IV restriction endonuclease